MKEYWVNVYWPEECIYGFKTCTREQAIINSINVAPMVKYRLHVREFDTREAKELYLKMKYGRKYTHDDFINDIQDIYA